MVSARRPPHEVLRDQRASKEKAARIANSDAASRREGLPASYEEWTKDELYDRARELDVEGRSSMSKDELIEAFRNG